MNPLYSHVDPSRIGSYRRALLEGEEYAKRLLNSTGNPDADDLAEHLVWDYPAHDFVIDFEEADALGLPVQRLPITQEKLLIDSLIGLMRNEIPYLGFAKPADRKAVAKKGKKKLPTSATAATGGNGAKRTAA